MKFNFFKAFMLSLFFIGFGEPVQAEPMDKGEFYTVMTGAAALAAGTGVYVYFFRESDADKIDKAYALLSALSVYGDTFYTSTSRGDQEITLNNCLNRLGLTVDEIDSDFFYRLRSERNALNSLRNDLWWRSLFFKSWYVDPEVSVLESKLYQYLQESKKVCHLFEKHNDFVKGYQLRNFYKSLPADDSKLENWVLSCQPNSMYPLSDYVSFAQSDAKWVKNLYLSVKTAAMYPTMVKQISGLKDSIIGSVQTVLALPAYKEEVIRKQKAAEQAARIEAERAKAEALAAQAHAMNNQAAAAMASARAASEANNIARGRDNRDDR